MADKEKVMKTLTPQLSLEPLVLQIVEHQRKILCTTLQSGGKGLNTKHT